MKYHGLIFDLDGTLIDSFRDIVDSWNEALVMCGFTSIHPDNFIEPMKRGKNAVIEMILPKYASKIAAEGLLETYKACYRQNWNRHTKAFPGVNELLAEIYNRGIKSAVLSNKSQDMTELCCETFLFTQGFATIRGASAKYLPKPFPAQALEIGRELSLPSSAIAMVGDTQIDLQTASNAGYSALLATWGGDYKSSSWILHSCNVLDTPLRILDHIKNID